MATAVSAATVALVLLQLFSASLAQSVVTVEFAETDFQDVEGATEIPFTLTVAGASSVDQRFVVTPYTFEEYQMQIGMQLPDPIMMRSEGLDRAESVDFPRQPVTIDVPASSVSRQDFSGTISITDDNINELEEIFLLLVEADEATSNNPEAPILLFTNNGLSIARIVDDDTVSFSFEEEEYEVNESDSQLPDTVRLVRDIPSEVDYTLDIFLSRGRTPATEGEDFRFTPGSVVFSASDDNVPIPIEILEDNLVEQTEDFLLDLVARADNPTTNIDIGPIVDARVSILDNDVLKVGFVQEEYIVDEGDGEVTVCARILSPLEDLPSPTSLIVFNIFAIPETAQIPDDFVAPTLEDVQMSLPSFGLNINLPEACTTITIVNDTVVGEGPETFQMSLLIDPRLTNVNVEVCPSNFTIQDRPVDECEEGLANCDPIAECIDLPVGFECICPPGYTGNGTFCEDIDECDLGLDNCSADAMCINTIGGFECECLPGFTGDGFICDDIDECDLGLDNCAPNAICINTRGSFQCVCPPGFSGNGTVCEDIDECEEETDNCDDNAICINTPGSFQCVCEEGYTGDGVTCELIPEVTPADPTSPPRTPYTPTICNPIIVMVRPRAQDEPEEDSTTRSTTKTTKSTKRTTKSTKRTTKTTGTTRSTTNTTGTTRSTTGTTTGTTVDGLDTTTFSTRERRSHSRTTGTRTTSRDTPSALPAPSNTPIWVIDEEDIAQLPRDDPCLIIMPYDPAMDPTVEEDECTPRTTRRRSKRRHKSRSRCKTKKTKTTKTTRTTRRT